MHKSTKGKFAYLLSRIRVSGDTEFPSVTAEGRKRLSSKNLDFICGYFCTKLSYTNDNVVLH